MGERERVCGNWVLEFRRSRDGLFRSRGRKDEFPEVCFIVSRQQSNISVPVGVVTSPSRQGCLNIRPTFT